MVATWSGAAQQATWDWAWSELTDALGSFRAATATATSGYSAGESANTASWG